MTKEEQVAELKKQLLELEGPPVVVAESAQEFKLDLGSGPRPIEGHKGVDIVEGVTDYCFDLCSGEPFPWADNSVDAIFSSHFIEHIPQADVIINGKKKNLFFHFFDECYRILKPGATITLVWPALQSVRAFQDPTHTRYIPHTVIAYLSVEGRNAMGVGHYNTNCDLIGTVNPSLTHEEALRNPETQMRRFNELWNCGVQDFHASLKANK